MATKLHRLLAALLILATATLPATGCALFEDEDEDEVREPFDQSDDDDDDDDENKRSVSAECQGKSTSALLRLTTARSGRAFGAIHASP